MHLGWNSLFQAHSRVVTIVTDGSYWIKELIAIDCIQLHGIKYYYGVRAWLMRVTGPGDGHCHPVVSGHPPGWSVLHNDCAVCTQASQTLITQSNNMNNLSAAAATDQIFAPRPGSLMFVWLQQSILCFSESSSGWPWGCVIFWLLASDLRMLENCSNSLRPHKMWVATKNQSRLEFWLKYWPQMTGAECG